MRATRNRRSLQTAEVLRIFLVHPALAQVVSNLNIRSWIFKAWLRRPQMLSLQSLAFTIHLPGEAESSLRLGSNPTRNHRVDGGAQARGPAGESPQAPFKTTPLVDAGAMAPKSKRKTPATSLPTQVPEEPIFLLLSYFHLRCLQRHIMKVHRTYIWVGRRRIPQDLRIE